MDTSFLFKLYAVDEQQEFHIRHAIKAVVTWSGDMHAKPQRCIVLNGLPVLLPTFRVFVVVATTVATHSPVYPIFHDLLLFVAYHGSKVSALVVQGVVS